MGLNQCVLSFLNAKLQFKSRTIISKTVTLKSEPQIMLIQISSSPVIY